MSWLQVSQCVTIVTQLIPDFPIPKMALRRFDVCFYTRFLRRTHPFGGGGVTLMNLWRLGPIELAIALSLGRVAVGLAPSGVGGWLEPLIWPGVREPVQCATLCGIRVFR